MNNTVKLLFFSKGDSPIQGCKMQEDKKGIYDFNQLEDMFEAIDSLTRATSLIAGADPQLAGELVKLTNTLMDFSESGIKVGVSEQPEAPVQAPSKDGIVDLTGSRKSSQKASILDGGDDAIIDVLTGEKVKRNG
jgi:hypothetical protein